MSVQWQDIAGNVGEFGTGVVICVVGVGDYGVDPVVAAVECDNDQHAGVVGQGPVVGRVLQIAPADRHRSGEQTGRADAGAGDQEPAAVDHDVRYSGVLTAAATSWGGRRTSGPSARALRSVHAPTPIR